jgi:hypothetical protein
MKDSKILKPEDVPILLLGYNRIDFLISRIDEISQSSAKILFLSIDGGNSVPISDLEKLIKYMKLKLINFDQIIIDQKRENLGLVRHITSEISKVLSQYSHAVIIEDDIELCDNFYELILDGFNLQSSQGIVGIVGGFSALNLPSKFFKNNAWRTSNYVSIWGWGCSNEIWKNYSLKLEEETISRGLADSFSWHKLSKFQKKVWLGRFNKIAKNPSKTWDIQLQYLSFIKDFTNLYPISTLVKNVGYSDFRSTNTKNKQPFWMSKKSPESRKFKFNITNKFLILVANVIDSNLLFSDTKLIYFWKHRFKLRLPNRF